MTLPIYSHRHLDEGHLTELLQKLPASTQGIHLALPTRKAIGARPRQVYQTMPQNLDLTGTLEGRFFWEEGELRWFADQLFHQGRHQRPIHVVAVGERFQAFTWQEEDHLKPTDQQLTTHLWPLMPTPGSPDKAGSQPGLLQVRAPRNAPPDGKTSPFPELKLKLRCYRLANQNPFWRWIAMEKISVKQEKPND